MRSEKFCGERRAWVAGAAVVALAAVGGCRQDAACFGADECDDGQLCVLGECVSAPEATQLDGGLAADAGFDAGLRTWCADIEPIIDARCGACHGSPPAPNVSLSLATFADTQAVIDGAPVHTRMAAVMAGQVSGHPPIEPTLSPLEILQVAAWSGSGAAEGQCTDASLDAGMTDFGPDAGFADTGFFEGGPVGTDPLPQVGTPMALPGSYAQLQGVAWNGGNLYFCAVGSDRILRFAPSDGSITFFAEMTRGASAIGFDTLTSAAFIAERTARRLVRNQGGTIESLANLFLEERFNGPDDLEVRSDGVIYFTDPPFNIIGRREMDYTGLFRVERTGTITREWSRAGDSAGPAGLALSPDETRLYFSDSVNDVVRVFDVASDGALQNERGFVRIGAGAAGMDTDRDGNLYVATEGGIEVFAPNGHRWGTIPVDGAPKDMVFGGEMLATLYVTTASQVILYPVGIPGVVRPGP